MGEFICSGFGVARQTSITGEQCVISFLISLLLRLLHFHSYFRTFLCPLAPAKAQSCRSRCVSSLIFGISKCYPVCGLTCSLSVSKVFTARTASTEQASSYVHTWLRKWTGGIDQRHCLCCLLPSQVPCTKASTPEPTHMAVASPEKAAAAGGGGGGVI